MTLLCYSPEPPKMVPHDKKNSSKRVINQECAIGTSSGRRSQPYLSSDTGLVLGPNASVLRNSDELDIPHFCASVVSVERDDDFVAQRPIPDLWIVIPLTPVEMAVRIGGHEQQLTLSTDHPSIIAPGTFWETKVLSGAQMLHVFMKRELVSSVADDLFEREVDLSGIVSKFDLDDAGMTWLRRALDETLLESPREAHLEARYLSRVLAAHVLRKHVGLTQLNDSAPQVPLTQKQARLIVSYIQEHLASKILMSDLTALVGLSQTSLLQRFKTSFRQPPHQYVMEARIKRARELLETSNAQLVEIAGLCGFSDQAHFSVTFKRLVGVTASRYRRMMS